MTRNEIVVEYENDGQRITQPGKFESEPLYAVYFWDCYLNGCADEDDGDVLTFDVTDEDKAEFPELQNVRHVFMWETDQGFVGLDTD